MTEAHINLLQKKFTPRLIWWKVKEHLNQATQEGTPSNSLQQYAVLGHEPDTPPADNASTSSMDHYSTNDSHELYHPVLLNTNAPWSAFLCGSQGSGKSHALSCMMENCLLPAPHSLRFGKNPSPLAGIVFHYDSSQSSGVCEAAYLCSSIDTKVLVSKSNYGRLKHQYESMAKERGGKLEVEKLELHPSHLNTERMKTLMAVGKEGEMPLYMHVVVNILRVMAIEGNFGLNAFNYGEFKKRLDKEGFSSKQNQPLALRMALLESFLQLPDTTKKLDKGEQAGDLLTGTPGSLTIVDLTDPVIDPESACVFFDICLSVFLSRTDCGTIITLDEAHNYMSETSAAAGQFTGRLLKTIREQRHQGARAVIATQEPTINTKLLDLCSIIMVHRCTSPAWFEVLKKHVAGLALSSGSTNRDGVDERREVFQQIVRLRLGESLLFCPTAATGMDARGYVKKMNEGFVKFRTRQRVTADGGRTRLAESTTHGGNGGTGTGSGSPRRNSAIGK